MSNWKLAGILLSSLSLGACTHLKGVVLDARTEKPVPNAVFTTGHPTGLGAFSSHPVNAQGEFDFFISPTDENHLYLWDGRGDSLMDVRRIDRSEISDSMRLHYNPSSRNQP